MLVDPRDGLERPVGRSRGHLGVAPLLLGAVGQVEAALVRGRHRLDAPGARDPQLLVARAAPRRRRSPSSKTRASVAPSSMACAAPWAMNGSIAWHASPSSVTRPADQRSSGTRSNSAQMNVWSTAPMIVADVRVPAVERRERVGDLAAIGPRLAGPRVLVDDRDEVHERLATDEVMDEVPARPHPDLRGHLEPEVPQTIGRHQPAVGGAAREARPLRAPQRRGARANGCRRRRRARRPRPGCRWRTAPRRCPRVRPARSGDGRGGPARRAPRQPARRGGRRDASARWGSRRPPPAGRRAGCAAASARRPSGAGARPAGARRSGPAARRVRARAARATRSG